MDQATLLVNLLTDGISTGALYALVAIGFSLLWWLADLIHLAHGAVVIAAGYAGYVAIAVLARTFHQPSDPSVFRPIWLEAFAAKT